MSIGCTLLLQGLLHLQCNKNICNESLADKFPCSRACSAKLKMDHTAACVKCCAAYTPRTARQDHISTIACDVCLAASFGERVARPLRLQDLVSPLESREVVRNEFPLLAYDKNRFLSNKRFPSAPESTCNRPGHARARPNNSHFTWLA